MKKEVDTSKGQLPPVDVVAKMEELEEELGEEKQRVARLEEELGEEKQRVKRRNIYTHYLQKRVLSQREELERLRGPGEVKEEP